MRKSTINSCIFTRKVLSIFLAIAFILTIVQPLSVLTVKATMPNHWTDLEEYYDISWYSEGPTVFNISTPQQLAGLAVLNNGLNGVQAVDFSGKTIQLSNNINLSEHLWTPIGTYNNQFKGTFDGDGFEIKSLNIDIVKGDNIFLGFGFFGEANGYIKNLGIDENSVIMVNDYSNGGSCVGAIVGKTYGSTIQNCYSKAAVSANGQNEADTYVGGIAGEISANTGKVLNCYNSGSVSATGNYNRIYAGGIAGANAHSGGTIQNCYSYSDSLSSVSSMPNSKAGGIVGWFCDSVIINSYWKTTSGAVNAIGYYQETENDKTITGLGSFADNSGTLTATDATTLSNGTNLLTALNTGTDVGDKSWGINVGVNNDYPVFGDYNKPSISTISTPAAISVGDSLSLSAPTVSDNGFAITESGWQLSASGSSGWNTYTNGALNGSFNNYYLRYYATNQYGTTYSNVVNITINKPSNALSLSCADITYGGTLSPIVTNPSGGAVSYQYKEQGTDDSTYASTAPANVGSYTMKATSAETESFNSATATVDFKINQADNSLSISCANITFGGTPNPQAVTNTSGGTVSYEYKVSTALDSTYTTTVPTAIGNYTVRGTSASTSNFNSATATADFSIGLASSILAISCDDIVFGQTPNPQILLNISGGAVSYEYKVAGAEDSTYSPTKPTNVGSYTVRATSAETANYNSATITANFAINNADNSLTISCENINYGETPNPQVTTNTSGGAVSYEYKVSTALDSTYTATAPTNAGSYTVRATSASTANYNQATATDDFVITEANNTFAISCDNIIYGGTPSPTVTTNTSGGAVSYEYKVSTALDSTYTTTVPTNVGSYTVRATSASTANYNQATATTNFVINKATLTASTNNASILQGGTIPTFNVTVTGFVNSESETLTGFVKPTVSYDIPDTTIDGDYPLTISGGTPTANYQFSYQTGAKLTIGVKVNAQAPSFNPNLSGEKTYTKNDTATALNGTATVSDSGTVTYKWYRNTTNSTTGGTEISGATDATFTPATNVVGAYYYYVVATNTNNSVNGTKIVTSTSNFAKVIVNNLEVLPVEATAETPKTQLKGEIAQIKNAVLTESDNEQLAKGSDISIWLDIKKIEAPTADENVMKLMLDGKEVGQYFDISLFKKIDGDTSKVTQTNGLIRITIEIPEALRNSGRVFSITRVHNGVATVLVDLDNDPNTITFETDQFSTYAIVYKEVSNTPAPATNLVAPATNPKTEQNSPIIPIALFAILTISTLAVVRKNRKSRVFKKG